VVVVGCDDGDMYCNIINAFKNCRLLAHMKVCGMLTFIC